MKKVFFSVLFLVLVGAGILWWLMQAVPQPALVDIHEPSDQPVGENIEGEPPHGVEHGEAVAKDEAKTKTEHEATTENQAVAELSISTDPVPAKIIVDGEDKGRSPYVLTLTNKSQKVEFLAEGFEPYSKIAPSLDELEGGSVALNWKIDLRAKKGSLESPPRAAHSTLKGAEAFKKKGLHGTEGKVPRPQPPVLHEISKLEDMWEGTVGPNFIQVKAVPINSAAELEEIKGEIARLRGQTTEKFKGCLVELSLHGKKQKFVRFLAGPYANRAFAREKEGTLQTAFEEKVFITGVQKCQSPKSSL